MSATEPEARSTAVSVTRPPASRLDEVLPERSRQYALASLVAGVGGMALAVPGDVGASIVGYVLASVGAVLLLTASRRADIAAVPAHDADPPALTRLIVRVILGVAVVAAVLNAWVLAPELLR